MPAICRPFSISSPGMRQESERCWKRVGCAVESLSSVFPPTASTKAYQPPYQSLTFTPPACHHANNRGGLPSLTLLEQTSQGLSSEFEAAH